MIIWVTRGGLLVVFLSSLASVKVIVKDRHVICVYIVYIYTYLCVHTCLYFCDRDSHLIIFNWALSLHTLFE